jgi:type I restriction enzyme S subunit
MNNILEMIKNEKVEWKKLGEVFYTRTGYTPSKRKREYWEKGTIPWITIDDIRDKGRVLKDANVKISNKAVKKNTFKSNSIIMSTIATIGEYALVKMDFVANQQFIVFTLKEDYYDKINMEYMRHYFSEISRLCKKNIRISSVPTVGTDTILKIKIPIPSIEIQEKIVKTLDEFTDYVTELQSELQSRTKQYEYYRDMLLSEEYLEKLSEETFTWSNNTLKRVKLSDIAKLNRGKRLVRSELAEKGKYPVFQNSLTPLGYYSNKNFNGNKTCIISAGAAGEIFFQDEDFWAADDVFVITTEEVLNKYLYYYLLNKQYHIKSKVRKASIPRLPRTELEKIEILIPSMELQNKVVDVLDKFQSLLSDTKGLLPEEIEQRQKQYEYYREKLLTFDVKDVNTHTHN